MLSLVKGKSRDLIFLFSKDLCWMYVLFCCAQQPALLQCAKAIYRTKQYNTYVSLELNMGKICTFISGKNYFLVKASCNCIQCCVNNQFIFLFIFSVSTRSLQMENGQLQVCRMSGTQHCTEQWIGGVWMRNGLLQESQGRQI